MAANKCVTVLAPNGHRQNVKVTPNTTILQVLEEVCQRQGYNSDDYDLKYYNRILDVNSIIRFANLANNAALEMVPCTKARKFSDITICIQTQDGKRLTGEFMPTATLAEVLEKLCAGYDEQKSTIVYMQREMHGKDQFESVTLRSLGLNSGRALLRLLNRDREQLTTQAHVYVPPSPKFSKTDSEEDTDHRRPSSHETSVEFLINKPVDATSLMKQARAAMLRHSKEQNTKNNSVPHTSENNETDQTMEIDEIPVGHEENQKIDKNTLEVDEDSQLNDDKMDESKVEYLGERNALLFNQADARSLATSEVSDDFYELTTSDARLLAKDAKRKMDIIEDSPLTTAAQRETESEKKKLIIMNKYKKAILRIQFPSQLVLQGVFEMQETVENVKDFVRTYLEDQEAEFYLYTSPPKKTLLDKVRLIDEGLVPCARIYYAGKSDLKPDVKTKLTDLQAVENESKKTRASLIQPNVHSTDSSDLSSANSTDEPPLPPLGILKKPAFPKWFAPSK